jgi:hypothetical protein
MEAYSGVLGGVGLLRGGVLMNFLRGLAELDSLGKAVAKKVKAQSRSDTELVDPEEIDRKALSLVDDLTKSFKIENQSVVHSIYSQLINIHLDIIHKNFDSSSLGNTSSVLSKIGDIIEAWKKQYPSSTNQMPLPQALKAIKYKPTMLDTLWSYEKQALIDYGSSIEFLNPFGGKTKLPKTPKTKDEIQKQAQKKLTKKIAEASYKQAVALAKQIEKDLGPRATASAILDWLGRQGTLPSGYSVIQVMKIVRNRAAARIQAAQQALQQAQQLLQNQAAFQDWVKKNNPGASYDQAAQNLQDTMAKTNTTLQQNSQIYIDAATAVKDLMANLAKENFKQSHTKGIVDWNAYDPVKPPPQAQDPAILPEVPYDSGGSQVSSDINNLFDKYKEQGANPWFTSTDSTGPLYGLGGFGDVGGNSPLGLGDLVGAGFICLAAYTMLTGKKR